MKIVEVEASSLDLDGWEGVAMTGGDLHVVVVPDHGAEIASLVHTPTGVEFLCQPSWGRPGPDDTPLAGAGSHEFLQRYAGGWQELWPNAGEPTRVDGEEFPLHGEAATGNWDVDLDDRGLRARFLSPKTGLELTRRMTFEGRLTLRLEESVINHTAEERHFTWGHHPVLGPPFLEEGCRLDLPATWGWVPTIPQERQRLEPTDCFEWPHALDRNGEWVDLSIVPGPGSATVDSAFLGGLTAGCLAVENPRLALRLEFSFDPEVFPWVNLWMPYGGLHDGPLAGMYGLGPEPWRTPLPLGQAIEAGEAIRLAPGARLKTELAVRVSVVRTEGSR